GGCTPRGWMACALHLTVWSAPLHTVYKLTAPLLYTLAKNDGLGKKSIGEAGLRVLSGFQCLEDLDLGHLQVPLLDPGLAQLSSLTGLQRLCLGGNDISSRGLRHLRGLERLRLLDLRYNKQISDRALVDLRQDLPDCAGIYQRDYPHR
ncbi:MAG: hypothetical protein JXR96_00160, partial [Deltaproteobacteria bacterium]|nr:hypothetical protein [Deltaproteobacteria bacterium]